MNVAGTNPDGSKKGLSNPTNLIIAFLVIVIMGLGVQVSIANIHFQEMTKQQKEISVLTSKVIALENHDHSQSLILLNRLLNQSRPH